MTTSKFDWVNLLKRDLIQFPPRGNEYHTRENLIVTIRVRRGNRNRQFTFGGPHWSASLYFSRGKIRLSYFSPLKEPKTILTKDIVEVVFNYLKMTSGDIS